MVYNPVLGSLYDKTQRISALSSYLCDEIKADGALKVVTLEAARLCKADLATRLVSEFPELQGIIGKYYIQDSRLKIQNSEFKTKQVADAVYEHSSKEVPQTLPGAVVSIADKIDTLVGFFSIGEVPTGTQDPYGLRRAAIGILNILLPTEQYRQIELNIKALIDITIAQYKHINNKEELKAFLLSFFYTRLEGIFTAKYVMQGSEAAITEHGSHLKDNTNIKKLIDAVIATEPDDILEADQRINALKDVVFKPDFEPIMLAFKRVINISKKHIAGEVNGELLAEPSEKVLYNSYLEIEPKIQSALAKGNYIGYINLIQNLVEPINTFFDKVLVMSDNENIKNNRLNMLAKIKNLVMQVLDITKLI
jgi:glycyl-tRNA synthetase beta chain